MDKPKTRLVGAGIAIAAAFVFLIIAFLNFPIKPERIFGEFKEAKDTLTFAQLVVSFFGFIGAISAFSLAIVQYRKSAKWKRMEFIANEVKEFESDPVVQNALLLIDWGKRRINLNLVSTPKDTDLTLITREDQWRALLPHPLKDKKKYDGYQSKKIDPKANQTTLQSIPDSSEEEIKFTNEEAKIRDTYDVFLTRLDRFHTFIDAKLIDEEELNPFINYWIDAITENTEPEKDAQWRFALLSYIIFYGYTGVLALFRKYGKEIKLDDKEGIYKEIKDSVQNQQMAQDVFNECEKKMKQRNKN
jgi:hypothetical protein